MKAPKKTDRLTVEKLEERVAPLTPFTIDSSTQTPSDSPTDSGGMESGGATSKERANCGGLLEGGGDPKGHEKLIRKPV